MLADARKDHCIPLVFYKNLIGDQLWKHLVDQIHQPQGPRRQFSSGTAKKSGQDKLALGFTALSFIMHLHTIKFILES